MTPEIDFHRLSAMHNQRVKLEEKLLDALYDKAAEVWKILTAKLAADGESYSTEDGRNLSYINLVDPNKDEIAPLRKDRIAADSLGVMHFAMSIALPFGKPQKAYRVFFAVRHMAEGTFAFALEHPVGGLPQVALDWVNDPEILAAKIIGELERKLSHKSLNFLTDSFVY